METIQEEEEAQLVSQEDGNIPQGNLKDTADYELDKADNDKEEETLDDDEEQNGDNPSEAERVQQVPAEEGGTNTQRKGPRGTIMSSISVGIEVTKTHGKTLK